MTGRKHVDLETGETDDGEWFAFDPDTDTTAFGKSEDWAESTWWALYGSLEDKYPRRDWTEYVSHE